MDKQQLIALCTDLVNKAFDNYYSDMVEFKLWKCSKYTSSFNDNKSVVLAFTEDANSALLQLELSGCSNINMLPVEYIRYFGTDFKENIISGLPTKSSDSGHIDKYGKIFAELVGLEINLDEY